MPKPAPRPRVTAGPSPWCLTYTVKLVAAQFPRNEARDADCLRLGLLKAPAKATKTEKNAKANA